MRDFEKLGAFYLGREYDQAGQSLLENLLLYDSGDLTTNAVCVGMTGSGKTGLCLSLLEEAAIDGIPTLAIDPKGDLGNLLLAFPELRPADFRPWIDEAEAAREGLSPDQFAARTAETWRRGLEAWGQDGARIRRFRDAADAVIYTPGSSAGVPMTVLKSFDAPSRRLLEDPDAFRDKVGSTVSGVLALLGIEADPIRSREHILIASILSRAWTAGRDLDLTELIRSIQEPPFQRVGVMDLESFYPAKERFELSLALNNLLASPGFAVWMEGEPLDVPRLLWTAEGKPRIAIVSIAHLSDAERMFFVTLLLNEVLAWIRTQPGTGSLRALLYMDEVFGYFPPTANPPSKKPMLTLLKQARAFGLGTVLTTQNPVDLDYKGLSNTGTWFLGRLQTERDKARVLEGLEGASTEAGAGFDRSRMEALLAGLKSRVFLMHNVHETGPVLFQTRWALSYLRGPLTRSQIATLMEGRKAASPPRPEAPGPAAAAPPPAPAPARGAPASVERPLVPPGVPEAFVAPPGEAGDGGDLQYRPALLGRATLHYVHRGGDLDTWEVAGALVPLDQDPGPDPWKGSEPLEPKSLTLKAEPDPAGSFVPVPPPALEAGNYARWQKQLGSHLYRTRTLSLWKCAVPKLISRPGESEGEFRARVVQASREKRDLAKAILEKKYRPKLERIQERIRRAQVRVEREKGQYDQQKLQTAVSLGATVLGALFGRKAASVGTVGRAATTLKGAGRTARERADIAQVAEQVRVETRRLADLEEEFREELASLESLVDPAGLDLEAVRVRPRKADITDSNVTLVWLPWKLGGERTATRAFP